jgi:hypothetical protein
MLIGNRGDGDWSVAQRAFEIAGKAHFGNTISEHNNSAVIKTRVP